MCSSPLAPLYASAREVSITSLCEVLHQRTEVDWCGTCGHLQTPQLADVEEYYARQYRILAESEDEDQLYALVAGRRVFRADHQLTTLLAKVQLPSGAAVLDHGCAKGATVRRLKELRQDLRVHLFEVSPAYERFWARFASPERWSTGAPKPEWVGQFDLITSFYALEHLPDPRSTVASIAEMLRPGGLFYCVVPDTYQNVGDFVVVDHVNHFSPASLDRLISSAGLRLRELDSGAHQSALVLVAERPRTPVAPASQRPEVPPELEGRARAIATYWQNLEARVAGFEAEQAGRSSAIYGAGFYGTFLATCLQDRSRLAAFLDQNPFRRGQRLLDRPILAPEDLPPDVGVVYVGLNPALARAEIAKVEAWVGRRICFFYP